VMVRILYSRKAKKYEDIHGTAHWADENEIKKMDILDQKSGVYIGGWQDKKGKIHYLRHNGPEHILVFAPTRSGKGVGLVIPTLLAWDESAVILDIKGENWVLTSGWRQKYAQNKVLKFEPGAIEGSVKYNPLEEIRLETEYEISDVRNVAMMLMDPDGKGLNDYWHKAGYSFLNGLILHFLYKTKKEEGRTVSLSELYKKLNDPRKSITDLLEEMLNYDHLAGMTHEAVMAAAREMGNKAPEEQSGVLGTVSAELALYADPIVAKNTGCSEFRLKDLIESKTSLYIVINPREIDKMRPLARLVMNQILRTLTDNAHLGKRKNRVLLMLDEFASLGKIQIFQEAIAYMAGYGVKAYIIVQDLTQLYNAYGKDESIMSNCHVRVAYAPNKVETAELLSKMAGVTTVVKPYVTTSGSRIGVVLGNVTETYQEVSRPLLTPDECMRLPGPKKNAKGEIVEPGDMLIFIAGNTPIYGKQILFFKDKVFLKRSQVPAPKHSDKVRRCKETANDTETEFESFDTF